MEKRVREILPEQEDCECRECFGIDGGSELEDASARLGHAHFRELGDETVRQIRRTRSYDSPWEEVRVVGTL